MLHFSSQCVTLLCKIKCHVIFSHFICKYILSCIIMRHCLIKTQFCVYQYLTYQGGKATFQ